MAKDRSWGDRGTGFTARKEKSFGKKHEIKSVLRVVKKSVGLEGGASGIGNTFKT